MNKSPELFDTNILIDALNGVEESRHTLTRRDDGAISVVSWMEVLAGEEPENEARARKMLADFERIELTAEIAERSVAIRKTMSLNLLDAIILATAQVSGRVLVTRNTKDFGKSGAGVRVPYRV